jgi:hypothetical protein
LGVDPVIKRGRHDRLRSPLAITVMAALTLFLLVTVVPVVPWQARCYEEPVPGPYRPIFLREVTEWLSQEDVYFWRFGGIIMLRLAPLFDGNRVFNRENTIVNIAKISDMLQDSVTIRGVTYPKPPAVSQVEEEQRARGTYDGLELCRAAIRPSPADPPVP